MNFGPDLIDNGTSDDYYTPPFIFEALATQFDMDVCAPATGVPWIPAKQSLSILEDGLTTEWIGKIWCNPPYSNVTPWAKKLLNHDNGIALLPAAKSSWFNTIWENCDGLILLTWQTKFIRGNGLVQSIMMPLVLVAFGSDNRNILESSRLGRVR